MIVFRLSLTQHITADRFVKNASLTASRHHNNKTCLRCTGVSRSQLLLVKQALVLVCVLCWLQWGRSCRETTFPSPSRTAASISHHSCCSAGTCLSICNTKGVPESLRPWCSSRSSDPPAATGLFVSHPLVPIPRFRSAGLPMQHHYWRSRRSLPGSRSPAPARSWTLQRSGTPRFSASC